MLIVLSPLLQCLFPSCPVFSCSWLVNSSSTIRHAAAAVTVTLRQDFSLIYTDRDVGSAVNCHPHMGEGGRRSCHLCSQPLLLSYMPHFRRVTGVTELRALPGICQRTLVNMKIVYTSALVKALRLVSCHVLCFSSDGDMDTR